MKKSTLLLLSVITFSSISFAGGDIADAENLASDTNGLYLSAGLAIVNTRGDSVDLDFIRDTKNSDRLSNLILIAGYDFTQYIALEGRYTFELSSAADDPVAYKSWSIFVKPQYPINAYWKVYALLGYGAVTMDERYDYFGHPEYIYPTEIDGTGFQWGVGVSYSLKDHIHSNILLSIDYTSLANDMPGMYWNGDAGANSDAITLAVTYKF